MTKKKGYGERQVDLLWIALPEGGGEPHQLPHTGAHRVPVSARKQQEAHGLPRKNIGERDTSPPELKKNQDSRLDKRTRGKNLIAQSHRSQVVEKRRGCDDPLLNFRPRGKRKNMYKQENCIKTQKE